MIEYILPSGLAEVHTHGHKFPNNRVALEKALDEALRELVKQDIRINELKTALRCQDELIANMSSELDCLR